MLHTVCWACLARSLDDCILAGAANAIGLLTVDSRADISPQELLIAVAHELFGKGADVGP